MNRFSETLALLMSEARISQCVLAQHLCVSQQSISRYLSGEREPCFDALIAIAKYFDISTDYLLGLDEY